MFGLKVELSNYYGGGINYRHNWNSVWDTLNYGIGWGWLSEDTLPINKVHPSGNACILSKISPIWKRIADNMKDCHNNSGLIVTPGGFLDRVNRAMISFETHNAKYDHYVTAYRIRRAGCWFTLETDWNGDGEWVLDYLTPIPSLNNFLEAANMASELYGEFIVLLVFNAPKASPLMGRPPVSWWAL